MNSLYTWMANNGLDPALIAYAGAAIALFALIKMYFFQKKNISEIEAGKAQVEKSEQAAELAASEKAAAELATSEKEAVELAASEKAAAELAASEKAAAELATSEKEAAELAASEKEAVELAASEKAAAELATSEKEAAELAASEQEAAELAASEKAAAKLAASEKVAAELAATEKAAAALAASEKAAAELAASEKAAAALAATEKAAAEFAASEKATAELAATEKAAAELAAAEPVKKVSFFSKVKAGLAKTKAGMSKQMGDLFLGAKEIDDELLEDLETILITSDIGMNATTEIISKLTAQVERSELKDPQALHKALKDELASILTAVDKPLIIDEAKTPFVILMVGVNGVGKTTTIGKLAKKYQAEGKSVMLAAGDTFRAAAVEQLQVWGDRNNVPVVAQHTGADSASVLFDALQSAKAKNVDVLIADTAGRLQNKDNLMQELEKVIRVMKKLDPQAPHEVMLVLDAGTGQNGLSQAQVFGDSVGVTGITLTKLDGTAKGGIIFAIAKSMNIPIRFIGVGEQVDDLQPFIASQFVDALFDQEDTISK